MKNNKIKQIRTGDIVLTNDIYVNFIGTEWPLFAIIGQNIETAPDCIKHIGMMKYEAAPAHIVDGSVVFNFLKQNTITIDYSEIRLVVGTTDTLRNNEIYASTMEEIVPLEDLRNSIFPIEDKPLISALVCAADDYVRSDSPKDPGALSEIFQLIFRRYMEADSADYCVEYFTNTGRAEICNLYGISLSEYMNTMKYLKDIIKKSQTVEE